MTSILEKLSSLSTGALSRLVKGGRLARLSDGTRVLVRPLRNGDRDALRQAIAALSWRTRYLRFHGPGPRPSEQELDLLLTLDGHDRAAWAAIEPGSGRGIGIARYARLAGDPAKAELAVTVIDDWQRRGLARILIDRLAKSAQAAGIERFCATILAENRAVLDWARRHGASLTNPTASAVEIAIPVAAWQERR